MHPFERLWPKFFLLILSAFGLSTLSVAAESRPNIIFIMADDLGYGDLGSYGQRVIHTPHLDRMAAEGIRFTDFYAGSPVCAPSRSVLMTGQHTGHTRVRGNFGKFGVVGLAGNKGRVALASEDVTIAEVLQSVGYRTGMAGKWGLGEPGTTGLPNDQGFDEWFGYLNQRRAHSYYPEYIWKDRDRFELPGNAHGNQGTYTHDLFTAFALDFVERHQSRPFFLYLPYTVPHSKYEIPDTAPYSDQPWTDDEKVHAAMITRLDRDIGQLFTRLQALGLDEKTLVFFCSDNGAAERWEGRFDSSGPLRGRKRDVYEGGIRSPMIVRWPSQITPGQSNPTPWYLADILPTLAGAAQAPIPPAVDGVNVLPVILGKQSGIAERFLYWEFFENGFQQAVRWGDWKAVRPQLGEPLEIYNLSRDLGETHNLAASSPAIVQTFEDYLRHARTASDNWPVETLD